MRRRGEFHRICGEDLENSGVGPGLLGKAAGGVVAAFFAGLEGVAVVGPEGKAANPGLLVGPGFEGARVLQGEDFAGLIVDANHGRQAEADGGVDRQTLQVGPQGTGDGYFGHFMSVGNIAVVIHGHDVRGIHIAGKQPDGPAGTVAV